MCKRFWQGGLLVLVMLLCTHPGWADRCTLCDLTNFCKLELNQIATLTAQMNALQQCDPVAAGLIASYIPDHQAQAAALSTLIACQGGNPGLLCPQVNPCVGSRAQIFQSDIQLQAQMMNGYACLKASTADCAIAQLAAIGWYSTSRHVNSLQVAFSATCITPTSTMDGLLAQLALEASAVADLQAQQCRLAVLGNIPEANQFGVLIAQHQQQVMTLQTAIAQMCGYPGMITVPPIYTLCTRDQIICQERITETQFINTYAMVTATLPPGPLHSMAANAQAFNLASLAYLEAVTATPTSVAIVPVPPPTTAALPAGG